MGIYDYICYFLLESQVEKKVFPFKKDHTYM